MCNYFPEKSIYFDQVEVYLHMFAQSRELLENFSLCQFWQKYKAYKRLSLAAISKNAYYQITPHIYLSGNQSKCLNYLH